jgi:hypothetical protein
LEMAYLQRGLKQVHHSWLSTVCTSDTSEQVEALQQPTMKGPASTPGPQPAICSGDFSAAGLDMLPLPELLRSQQSWA